MFLYSKDHKVVRRDRIKIATAGILNRLQCKLDAKGSALVTLKFELINPYGKIEKTIYQKSNSLVRNYYNWSANNGLCHQSPNAATYGAGYLAMKDTGGTIRTVGSSSGYYINDLSTAQSNYGILVGTSATAESIEDYILGAKVTHGNGAGQMYYYDTQKTASYNGGTLKWSNQIKRTIMNNSGASITINEVGYVAWLLYIGGITARDSLVIRDVPTPMPIANGGGIVVTYTITYQF